MFERWVRDHVFGKQWITEPLECRTLLSAALNTLASFTSGANPVAGEPISPAVSPLAVTTAPEGNLVIDADGDLFGTATGGEYGDGEIFEIAAGSKGITKSIPFYDSVTGSNPTNLAIDSQGNLFGRTVEGGPSSNGCLFELPARSSKVVVLAPLPAGVVGLTGDANGNLFLTVSPPSGASREEGEVLELAAGGSNLSLVAESAWASPTGSPTLDDHGDIFYASEFGEGQYVYSGFGYGGVFELPASSDKISVVSSSADNSGPFGPVTIDSYGNIFGEAAAGYEGYGSIFEIPSGTSTVYTLENFGEGSNNAFPDLVVDENGNVYGTKENGSSNSSTLFELPSAPLGVDRTIVTLSSFSTAASHLISDSVGDLFGETSNSVFEYNTNTSTLATLASGFSSSVSPEPPQLNFVSQPSTVVAGTKMSAVVVETDDSNGYPITTGKSKITLSISSGGKLVGRTNASVKNGKATFSNLSVKKTGSYALTASDPTFVSATSTTFTVSPGPVKKLAFNSQPANQHTGTPFNVSVEVFDTYGNLADGGTVDLVLGSHPNGASALNLSAALSDGTADFPGITLDTAGNYTFLASDGKSKAASKKFGVA